MQCFLDSFSTSSLPQSSSPSSMLISFLLPPHVIFFLCCFVLFSTVSSLFLVFCSTHFSLTLFLCFVALNACSSFPYFHTAIVVGCCCCCCCCCFCCCFTSIVIFSSSKFLLPHFTGQNPLFHCDPFLAVPSCSSTCNIT